ncbi:MAG: fimbrillin family protein [Tannerellaceae bacterium]|jgi:hypothetical protein|nr:fimbrillin family protein [Tannerellaceae bacterium]
MNGNKLNQKTHDRPLRMFRWIPALATALLLAGCVNEETAPDDDYDNDRVPVRFSAGIGVETRVSNPAGDQWDATDTIGVYMIRDGSTLADTVIREEVKNKAYIISSGTGTSTAAFVTAGDMAYYPNGENVNFIAYYPYSTSKVTADYKYLMDIGDQRNPSRLDLLYSNDKAVYSSKNHNAVLPFEHLMTRVVFEVIMAAGSSASLANLQMEMYDVNTSTEFDLSDGTPAADGAGQGVLTPLTLYQASDSVRMEATLIPTNNAAAIHLYFMLNNKAYTAPLPTTPSTGTGLLKGKRYTYKVVFDETEITLEGQLTAWGEEAGDTIAPTPDTPITVPHAQIMGYRGPVTVAYASGSQETITLNGSGQAAFDAAFSGDVIESLTLNNTSTPTPILIGRKVADANPLQLKVDASGKPALRNAVNGYIPIGSYAEFQLIRDPANLSGKYKQENDIDLLDEDWVPIGTGATLFTGEYDGGEYDIANLKIDGTASTVGLFGIANNATLRNIHLVSGSVAGVDGVGSLCGRAYGNTSIDNCHSGVDVTGTTYNAGGFCGMAYHNSTVTSCIYMGKVKGENNVGGILGTSGQTNSNIKIINCENRGDIEGNTNVGGILGLAYFREQSTNVEVTACRNSGTVANTGNNTGGIVGSNSNNINSVLTVTACYNTGAVSNSGTGANIGGIVGNLTTAVSTITACYNTGTVTGVAATTGFICGNNAGTIASCYWTKGSSTATQGVGNDTGTSDTKEFSATEWPNAASMPGWGTGNGSADNTYWKALGGWNGGTPDYPVLWWE